MDTISFLFPSGIYNFTQVLCAILVIAMIGWKFQPVAADLLKKKTHNTHPVSFEEIGEKENPKADNLSPPNLASPKRSKHRKRHRKKRCASPPSVEPSDDKISVEKRIKSPKEHIRSKPGFSKQRSLSSVSSRSIASTVIESEPKAVVVEGSVRPKDKIMDFSSFVPEVTIEVKPHHHPIDSPVSTSSASTAASPREELDRSISYDSYSSVLKSGKDSFTTNLTPVFEDAAKNETHDKSPTTAKKTAQKKKKRGKKKQLKSIHEHDNIVDRRRSEDFHFDVAAKSFQVSQPQVPAQLNRHRGLSDLSTSDMKMEELIRQKKENIARLRRQNYELFVRAKTFNEEIWRRERMLKRGDMMMSPPGVPQPVPLAGLRSLNHEEERERVKVDLSFLDA